MNSIKYFPFGGCWESQGNLPEQQFTGQRLDSTGLDYYGARYYDPHIGRFISPDTIIPKPANPQAFNRYSYCLNNPLKYIDPSGHDVEIYGINIEEYESINSTFDKLLYLALHLTGGSVSDFIIMYDTWNTLTGVVGDLTQKLLESDVKFKLQFGQLSSTTRTVLGNQNGDTITLDNSLKDKSNAKQAVATLGHESLHGVFWSMGELTNGNERSRLEEALCRSLERAIRCKLGFYMNIAPDSTFLDNITPKGEKTYKDAYMTARQDWRWWFSDYNNPRFPTIVSSSLMVDIFIEVFPK